MSSSNYLGELTSGTPSHDRLNNTLLKEAYRNSSVPAIFFFFKKYNAYPLTMEPYSDETANYSGSHFFKIMKEEFNHDTKDDIVQYYHSNKHGVKYQNSHLTDLGNGVMVFMSLGTTGENNESKAKIDFIFEKSYHFYRSYNLFYLPGKEEIVDKVIKALNAATLKPITEASLQMICKNQCGFYLTAIKIKKPTISDLKLHYGPEFEKIHNTVIAALKADEAHGLILLHGLPGSGKTHYIRYLIQEIKGKQLIYIPPDMTSSISTPEFFPFMLQHKDSILIIEDAENIIKSRDSRETTTQSVANLLNLSDGLLGDSLHQPIIATFNCELNTIDPALLRKGRLISEYEFGKLNVDSAQKLSDELGYKRKISEPMTLADIYGQEEEKKQE